MAECNGTSNYDDPSALGILVAEGARFVLLTPDECAGGPIVLPETREVAQVVFAAK